MFTVFFFFFKQKTAYEMRISDWSSDVCSSDLPTGCKFPVDGYGERDKIFDDSRGRYDCGRGRSTCGGGGGRVRQERHAFWGALQAESNLTGKPALLGAVCNPRPALAPPHDCPQFAGRYARPRHPSAPSHAPSATGP